MLSKRQDTQSFHRGDAFRPPPPSALHPASVNRIKRPWRTAAGGRGCVKTPRYFVFGGLLTPPKVAIVEYSAI